MRLHDIIKESENMCKEYGYVRVSTKEQNEARQIISMEELHIPHDRIFVDHVSGKDFNRPQWKKLIRKIRRGDVIYIKSIDRLGRNYPEILEQWRYLNHRRGVDIVVIDMPLLDTRKGKDLYGNFIGDLVLQILSFVAENEKNMIHERQAEGIAAAKSRGKRFGRPQCALPDKFFEAVCLRNSRAYSITQAAKHCRMPRSTLYFKARVLQAKKKAGMLSSPSDAQREKMTGHPAETKE